MHNQEWSGPRVAAALTALTDAGISQSRLAQMAGVNRSQVSRWSRGENRPGYDPVRKLSAAIWHKHPRLARELVEASGYAWAEPQEAPEPDPIPPEVLRMIQNAPRDEQWKRDAIEALEAIERERHAGEQSAREQRAG